MSPNQSAKTLMEHNKGEELFYSNCAYCHRPIDKDIEFARYLDNNDASELINKQLEDKTHQVDFLQNLSADEIEKIVLFIQKPIEVKENKQLSFPQ